jgi:hypothetical protein
MEERLAAELRLASVPFAFEEVVVPYVRREATYRPDFHLLQNGILIESKGYFLPEDRSKHLLIKEQHPDLDIRFVFQRARAPLRKGSRTTYSSWAEKHGFLWAEKSIPPAWISEPPQAARVQAIERLTRKKAAK